MIDQELIQHGRQQLATAVSNAVPTFIPQLYRLENCLPIAITQKLWLYIQCAPDASWNLVEGQECMARRKITWHADTVIEELHLLMESFTSDLSERFDRDLNFLGISIWRDLDGYTIPWHTDNPVISVAMQIYLFGNSDLPGTEFAGDLGVIRVPFQSNNGYLLDNRHHHISHRTPGEVQSNHERYSLYSVWSLDTKKMPDTQ